MDAAKSQRGRLLPATLLPSSALSDVTLRLQTNPKAECVLALGIVRLPLAASFPRPAHHVTHVLDP